VHKTGENEYYSKICTTLGSDDNRAFIEIDFIWKKLAYANNDGKHMLWMYDQSDHAVFVRSDLTAEYVPKAAATI
jgi:hypothetical protein